MAKPKRTLAQGNLTAADIYLLARRNAQATLAPDLKAQAAERARTKQQYALDQQKIQGVSEAEASLLPGIFNTAAQVQSGVNQGVSSGVQAALAKMPGADPSGTGSALNYLGGLQPANAAAQGAYAAQGALGTGAAAVRSSIYAAHQDDQKILAAINELRAKRPELVQQAISQIADVNLRTRAQLLYEKQYGLDQRKQAETERTNRAQEFLTQEGLDVRSANDLADANAAAARGQQVNASASTGLGYLVDQHGNPIRNSKGQLIRLKDKPSSSRSGDPKQDYQSAVGAARDIKGDPVPNPNQSAYVPGMKGAYLARPDAKGVYRVPGKPPTTNDPTKAQYASQYTFPEAVGYLMDRYGINRKQATRALLAGGWRRPTARPQPKPKTKKSTA